MGNSIAGSSVAPGLQVSRRKRFLRDVRVHRAILIMLIPGLVYYIIFKYVPMYGISIAFKDFNVMSGLLDSPWLGTDHFESLFSNASFWRAFRNTFIISGLKLLFFFPAPIILAILLNEVTHKGYKQLVQTITYLPHFLSWVVLAGIVMAFLSPSSGPVNAVIKSLGGDPVLFIAQDFWFRPILVLTTVWKDLGWASIVYLAALSTADPQLYESAMLDGATKFQQIRYITLPVLVPVITIMLIFAVGRIVNDDFEQILNLYNPLVYDVGDVMQTFVYRNGLQNARFAFATAAGLVRNVISFVLVVGTNWIARRFSDYALW